MPSEISEDVAKLIERLQGEEALDWEIKAARGGLPNSVWETVSAFANTRGGWLILGVAERDGARVIQGVADPVAMVRHFHDLMRNGQRINHPVCGANDVSIVTADGERVVVVRVPPAPRRSRPIYIQGNPYNGTYVRREEGDYPATRPEVDRMMREASDLAADEVVLDGYTEDDLDRSTFASYRRRFQTANPESPHNALSDDEFLGRIGGFRRERETGREGITVAGLLMFGTDEAIRSWRGRHMIDFRVVPGNHQTAGFTQWHDRIVWEGNLLGAFDAIYRQLVKGLPVPFAVVDGVRVDQTPQQTAIREAFVNLLLHADYTDRAASLVIRSDDGYFLRNPGNSRVPDVSTAFADRSDPRNPSLVRMFRFIGLAEEAGSGVPRIFRVWKGLGYELPVFDVGSDRNEFSVHLSFSHLLSDDDRSWLENLDVSLADDEQLALVMARHQGYVDNASLRQVTGRHLVDVTRVLGHLRDLGLLRMIGAKRGARYELGGVASEVDDRGTEDYPPSLLDLSPSTVDYDPSSEDTRASTADYAASTADPSAHVRDQLVRLAQPVRDSGRLDSRRRDEIIVEMCRLEPLSLSELSQLLDRNPAYLRQVLSRLVTDRTLHYQYPDRPQHPGQRYIAGN
jgi:ATP-dependent DNA helicase RecG